MPDNNFTNGYITELRRDPEIVAALNTVLPLINTNKTVLGLTTQQVTDLTALCNTFITQYNTANTAKVTAKSATELKDIQKKAALASLFAYIKQWRANLAISDALLEQLMVAPHNVTRTETPPVTPTQLNAKADGQGNIELKWNRNGNKATTQYVIETRTSPSGDWTVTGITTKQRYELTRTPGEYIGFRVFAARADMISNPTAPVSLWEDGNTFGLQVAA